MEFCKAFNAKTQEMEKGCRSRWSSPYQDKLLHLRDEAAAGELLPQEGRQRSSPAPRPPARVRHGGQGHDAPGREIAEAKMKDMNATRYRRRRSMIEGSARSMGLEVVG
jgi:large subunit ribosomal protein L11